MEVPESIVFWLRSRDEVDFFALSCCSDGMKFVRHSHMLSAGVA